LSELNGRVKRLLVVGLDDWVAANEFIAEVEDDSAVADADIRSVAMEDMRVVVCLRLFEPGDYGGGGFTPWNVPVHTALDRIEARWRDLGRDPISHGEVASFNLTPEGARVAESLLESGEDLGFKPV
jgi:hypothetical protein